MSRKIKISCLDPLGGKTVSSQLLKKNVFIYGKTKVLTVLL